MMLWHATILCIMLPHYTIINCFYIIHDVWSALESNFFTPRLLGLGKKNSTIAILDFMRDISFLLWVNRLCCVNINASTSVLL